jgi:hypothetical protein
MKTNITNVMEISFRDIEGEGIDDREGMMTF